MLLKKIEEISAEKKQDERLVFISEFNHKIFEIIHNEPTPFIYERLGERYHHYLLDEFQDTSALQWQNILPLLDNSLSSGWFNLVVGDGKQSIYRWRNADVTQFTLLPKISQARPSSLLDERSQTLQRNFEEKLLDTNFRSLETVVHFNNELFGTLSEQLLTEDYRPIYAGQSQQVRHKGKGYVSVHSALVKKDDYNDQTFGIIMTHIRLALESGFALKDICILCRKNQHGNLIANYLMEQKIAVVSSDSLLLKNNLEVNTILNYLACLVNDRDQISAASVLNYLVLQGRLAGDDFHRYLRELATGKSLFAIFKLCGIALHGEKHSLDNLLDNCITIINALNLQEHAYNYVRFFLDEVNEFLVVKNSNVLSFLDWWQTRSNRASIIIPDTTNAVKIMTIHASKGLEFPVVIVPYCNWAAYKMNDSWVQVDHAQVELPVAVIGLSEKVKDIGFGKELQAEKQDQLLDNLNLLYVAFTRAVERLHILTLAPHTLKGAAVSDWINGFVKQHYTPSGPDFYETGTLLPPQLSEARTNATNHSLSPIVFNTSENVVRIKSAYFNNSQEAEQAKRQGINMHSILSKIRSAEDLEPALATAKLEGLLNKDEIPPIREKLERLLHHPELARYFTPDVTCKLEAELVRADGQLLRPDRIIFHPTETVLIDYKTGKENTAKYLKQMQAYEIALQEMGYPSIKKLLVYVDELNVVTVK